MTSRDTSHPLPLSPNVAYQSSLLHVWSLSSFFLPGQLRPFRVQLSSRFAPDRTCGLADVTPHGFVIDVLTSVVTRLLVPACNALLNGVVDRYSLAFRRLTVMEQIRTVCHGRQASALVLHEAYNKTVYRDAITSSVATNIMSAPWRTIRTPTQGRIEDLHLGRTGQE